MRLLLVFLVGCSASDSQKPRAPRATGVIQMENTLPGDPSWPLDNPAYNHELEGYGSKITLRAGDSLDVMVNADQDRDVTWQVFRLGWYGGAGARKILEGGPAHASRQQNCPHDARTQRVECQWSKTFSVTVPKDAVSGAYLIKLKATFDAYVPFVVYDGRIADVAMNLNVTSWQAYNNFGGESLYQDDSGTMPHQKAWEVSFDRPFNEDHGAGRLLKWEVHMIKFIEALGYDVTYTTALDITHDPGVVSAPKMFLSVANDEYWTYDERMAVQGARDHGVNLAFLGADQALWRVRLKPSSGGTADRVVVCYKADYDQDPDRGSDNAPTAMFRDSTTPGPESKLIGVMYDGWVLVSQPLVISDSTHWLFDGTNLRVGDTLPFMVSFETDGYFSDMAPSGAQILGQSPFVDAEGDPNQSVMTYYTAASGAQVVGAGTMGWASGLGASGYTQPVVAKITRNLIDRLSGTTGAKDPDGAPWLTVDNPPRIVGEWSPSVDTPVKTGLQGPSGVAVDANGNVFVADAPAQTIYEIVNGQLTRYAGSGIDGTDDGPGMSARFRWPSGLAAAPDGTIYVADTDNHTIRAIAPDDAHTVTTFAGVPTRGGGFAEGAVDQAQFYRPVAVALEHDGSLLVADMHNCLIRQIANGRVTIFAGSILGYQDGSSDTAEFNNPSGVAVGPDGSVYVLDTYNQAIRRIKDSMVTTLVGGDGIIGLIDGPGTAARLGVQAGMTFTRGQLFVSDVGSARIRAITPGDDPATTRVVTFAGSGRLALEDGSGDMASLSAPMALAAASDGTIWLADAGNKAVRRLAPAR